VLIVGFVASYLLVIYCARHELVVRERALLMFNQSVKLLTFKPRKTHYIFFSLSYDNR
jgi:hypothetical protein